MRTITYLLLLLSPLWIFAQSGQLANQGTLYVSPETLLTAESHFVNQASGTYTNDGEVLLRGNFHNDGLTLFTQGEQGYTRFQGYQPQEISGAIAADFYDILFDNDQATYSFALSGDLHVFGQADFYRGIVDNFNYGGSMTFEQGASHIATSDRSYVEGEVFKTGEESFIFPIGKEEMYRPGGFIALDEQPTYFVGQYHAYNSHATHPHEQHEVAILDIDDKEFWTIENTTNDGEILIQLTWDERITPFRLLEDEEALVVVAWDTIDEQWVSLGGAVDSNYNLVTSLTEGQAYELFTLGTIRVIPEGHDFVIYNAVNPGDTYGNEYFKIVGLEHFPDNRVRVYNRWGVLVFDEHKYDTHNNVFTGISNGRTTLERGDELPVGTYFYILDYVVPETGKSKSIQGYLYLNR